MANTTDTEALTTDEVADFFDAILDGSWTRQYNIGWHNDETAFLMGSARNPQVKIHVNDGEVNVTEYDDHGCIVAETRMSGDMKRLAPRVLAFLGIDA